MNLTPEQQELVRAWAARGDSISDIQTQLASECGVHLSYMDTRFLLIDLSVSLVEKNAKKEEPPAASAAPESAGGYDEAPPLPEEDGDADLPPAEDAPPPAGPAADGTPPPPGGGDVRVEMARIQRPGFAVSGSVSFSDGVKGEWGLDNYGRLALAFPDNKDYRPSAADQQTFMEKLRGLLSAGY